MSTGAMHAAGRTPAHDRPPARTAVVGLLVMLPSLAFVGLSLLRFELGIREPYESLRPLVDPSSALGDALLTAVVLLGPVVALVLAAWPVLRAVLRRDDGSLVATVRLQLSWPHIAVGLIALGLGAFLLGHIVIETIAERGA